MFLARKTPPVSLADTAGMALMQRTLDAVHLIIDGVIVECNPAFEQMMGYSRAEILYKSPGMLSPERQPSGESSETAANAVIARTMKEGRHRFEWTHVRKDGSPIPILATLVVLEVNGKPAILSQLHDLTEQHSVTGALSEGLGALAAGNLGHLLTRPFPSEYELLRENYNQSVHALAELVGGVVRSTDAIRIGAHEIAQASADLARRTETNAANLEETSAATNQLDDHFRGMAQGSERTVGQADESIRVVHQGRAITDDAVAAMARVAASAKGIDQVIEGLDKIAFQTRVLAMNAAVEAGRAGDAGRGFAVVADLVSALAMRSEEEAKRARGQLTTTQVEVGTAVDAVRKVDDALERIAGNVGQVHDLLGTMATDNVAQAGALKDVAATVNQMNLATQQNAAMVEQTSAAAANLSGEVSTLAALAQRFTFTSHDALAAVRPSPRRPAERAARNAESAMA